MEWSEFVMFVIEQVVQDTTVEICEKFSLVNEMAIQESASRTNVTACKYIKDFNKLFVGIDGKLSIFSPNPRVPTWLDLNLSIPMKTRMGKNPEAVMASGKVMDLKLTMNVIDMVFVESKELLCVLRSDLRIDFFDLCQDPNCYQKLLVAHRLSHCCNHPQKFKYTMIKLVTNINYLPLVVSINLLNAGIWKFHTAVRLN